MSNKSKFISGTKPNAATDLTREAYNDIRRMIFLNELRPGQKVAYRDMAAKLGMSLTPVVQALKHMDFLGLLRHEPNRGFFVQPITLAEIREAYELREVLELNLIPQVIAHLDVEGEIRLKDALEAYLESCRSGSLKLRLAKDINFHLTLAEISKQSITTWILRYLLDFLYLRFEKELIFSRPQESSASEHQKIFESVSARETHAACKAMRDHICNIRDNVLENLQNRLLELEKIDI